MSESVGLGPRARWILLVTVSAGLLMIGLDNSILFTALPSITMELGASASEGLWIINAYPLVMAGLLLGAGTLGDRIGHKRMFLAGLVLFAIASLVAAFAPSVGYLIAGRAFLAVGAASMMPATLALIRVGFTDERERNMAIAVWGAISIIGSAAGPIVGGLLLERFWWGSVFLINVPIALLAFIATIFVAPEVERDDSRPWDLLSSVLALFALSGVVFAIKEALSGGGVGPVLGLVLAIAVAAGYAFVRRQRHLPYPLLDFALFKNPALSAGVMAAAFGMFALSGLQLATSQRFQMVANYTAMEAGLLVSSGILGAFPGSLIGGFFLHKTGPRPMIAGGLALGAVGLFLTAWGYSVSVWWVVAAMVILGAGMALAMASASAAIIGNAPVHRAGMASSVEEVSYEFGSLSAVALLGSLLTAIYSAGMVSQTAFPAEAADSMAAALRLAREGTQGSEAMLEAANAAFDRAYTVVLLFGGAVLVLGSVLTFRMLRGAKIGAGH